MKVLVTGANGFIGRHVCLQLQAAGHTPVGLMRPGARLRGLEDMQRVQGDVTVPRSLPAALTGCDAVIHLAGVKQAVRESTYTRVNAEGSAHLAEAARAAGIKRVVFISTIAAQGPSPTGHPHRIAGSEAPLNAYGRSKLSAEQRMRAILGDALIVLRPCLVYGPDDRHLLTWARMVQRRLVPMAEFDLSMVHVDDLARATMQALLAPPIAQPLFISDGQPTTFEALINQLERLVANGPVMRVPLPRGFVSRWLPVAEAFGRLTGLGTLAGRRLGELTASGWACQADAAKEALHYAPQWTHLQGVPTAIAAMQAAGELAHRVDTSME